MMGQTLVVVVLFVAILAMLPLGIKWVQRRTLGGGGDVTPASRLVSALAVGPQQRVVIVEVGPEGSRTWLVLGVTGQAITCLHSIPIDESATQPVTALSIVKDEAGNG